MLDKCVDKKLVKDNAKSFDERQGHSCDLMRCVGVYAAPRPSTLPHSRIYTGAFAHPKFISSHSRLRTYAAAFVLQLSRLLIFAAAFTPPPALSRIYAPALTPFTLRNLCRYSIHAAAFFRRSHAAALMPSLSRCHIYAAEFTPPHARRHFYAARRMHAAAFTPLSRRRIDAVALTPQHWCRSSDAAASHAAAFFGRSISPSTSRCRIHAVAFTLPLAHRSICAAALAGALCRWKRTTRSAFFNAEHDAGGRELARAGRGGAGGGRFLKRGVLGWGGGALYVRTYPRKGCVTAE